MAKPKPRNPQNSDAPESATTTQPDEMALVFKSVVTTFFLEDEEKATEKAVTASWIASEGGSGDDNVDYQLTITKESALDEHLSLFTLGVQSQSHAVRIVAANGFNLRIYEFGDKNQKEVKGPPYPIPKANGKKGIHMIAFSGKSCVLLIQGDGRKRIGPTQWKKGGSLLASSASNPRSGLALSHHDNMPPGGTTEN